MLAPVARVDRLSSTTLQKVKDKEAFVTVLES